MSYAGLVTPSYSDNPMAPIQANNLLTTISPFLTIQYPSVVEALFPLSSNSALGLTPISVYTESNSH